MAFWATNQIVQPIQPMRQAFFALSWSLLEKPLYKLNYLDNFAITSSTWHEKCCQILEMMFEVFFQINISCLRVASLEKLKVAELSGE